MLLWLTHHHAISKLLPPGIKRKLEYTHITEMRVWIRVLQARMRHSSLREAAGLLCLRGNGKEPTGPTQLFGW